MVAACAPLFVGKKIIEIYLNEEGFYEPYVMDEKSCTNCGLCMDVCAYSHDDLASGRPPVRCYAAWSKDRAVRKKSSSGGVSFELGRALIERGYKVCGVRYNAERTRAEHYVAATLQELAASMGSKYIQSYTVDGFRSVGRKEKSLVIGTPCQIDSVRRYIQRFKAEDNFVLMDFFCHGTPSMLLWEKYVREAERITGKIACVSWRNKFAGWHGSFQISISGEKSSYNSLSSKGDLFYKFFLNNACLGRACYEKCKGHSSSDIRIGDLWGKTYQYDENGVSAVVTFTERSDELFRLCSCEIVEHPFAIVAEGQMRKSPNLPRIRKWLLRRFRSGHSLRGTMALYKLYCLPVRIIHKLGLIK